MVLLGFVIKKGEGVGFYIERFKEVFKDVKAHPFTKKPLFKTFNTKTKIFNDRVVFIYNGNISILNLFMLILDYGIITLLLITLFFIIGSFKSLATARMVIIIMLVLAVMVRLLRVYVTSKYSFWLAQKRSMNRNKFGLRTNKKKLLSNAEIINCFVWGIKPLFKDELGD